MGKRKSPTTRRALAAAPVSVSAPVPAAAPGCVSPPAPAAAPGSVSAPVAAPAAAPTPVTGSFPTALALPVLLEAVLVGLAFVPDARREPSTQGAFVGVAGVLLIWTAVLFLRAGAGRWPRVQILIRRPHWMQPLVQITIYLYWSTTWPEVGRSVHLLAAQLAFAYAFDMLLIWSRRETYQLGFGPWPIVLSLNFFLWFRPPWFCLQFVMLAFGFAAKEFIRWQRDGRRTHVFNPSSFPLAVASVALLAGGVDHLTFGNEIAVSLEWPRHIFELIFIISLPAQFLFGIATMTLPALLTVHALSAVYFALFGTYYFVGGLPLPVFIGMLLLVTDPATAPRTDLGRIMYGVLYGLGTFAAYGLLDYFGQKTFYDKLLPIPLVNLSVRALDRLATSPRLARLDPGRWLAGIRPRAKHLVYMTAWAIAFVGVRAVHGLGDTHPANRLPFWLHACDEGRRNACKVVVIMESVLCGRGSGWACNELGIYVAERRADLADRFPPAMSFAAACQLDFEAGCINAKPGPGRRSYLHRPPSLGDYELLLESKALPRHPTAGDLVDVACAHGWTDGCMSMGYLFTLSDLVRHDAAHAVRGFERACAGGLASGCVEAAAIYRAGAEGVTADPPRADRLRARACLLGLAPACAKP